MKTIAREEYEPWLAHDPRAYLMYAARARELQCEAIGNALGTAGRFLAGTAAGAYRWIADRIRKRQTIAQLSRFDDHMLADIGIDREQIPMIAQGLIAPSGEAPRRSIAAATCPPEYLGDAANDTRPPAVAA